MKPLYLDGAGSNSYLITGVSLKLNRRSRRISDRISGLGDNLGTVTASDMEFSGIDNLIQIMRFK